MTESALRRAVLRQIRKRWPTAWVLGGRHSVAGVPDFCIVHPLEDDSTFTAIELKTPRGLVSPIQAATLARIRRAGGRARVVRRVEELCSATGS